MQARSKNRKGRRAFAGAIVAALLGVLALGGTVAALNGSTSNDNNRIDTGTVTIQDNDNNSAMFSLSGLKPGDTSTACIKLTYTGSLGSTVRLYGATTGTGLEQYASLQITRGSYSGAEPSFPSCTNFSADSTTYINGQAAGVVYAGTLSGFPTSWATGQVDPSSTSPATWTTNTARVYKLQVTLGDNASAAGKNATQTFTWEAQNN
jgi:Camelysin metallo-endopeptidase